MEQVFEVSDRQWRGIGADPHERVSGCGPNSPTMTRNWSTAPDEITAREPPECISALVLQGLKKPVDCAAFGTLCTPERPLGAPMVSSEGRMRGVSRLPPPRTGAVR